jgi:hypothetical protein
LLGPLVVLSGQHGEWQTDERRYLSEGSMALLYPHRDTGLVAAINSGEYAPRITSKPRLSPAWWCTTW